LRLLTALCVGLLTGLLVACGGSSKSGSTPTTSPSASTSATPKVSATAGSSVTAVVEQTTATPAAATATSAPATNTPEAATPTEVPPTEVPATDTPVPPTATQPPPPPAPTSTPAPLPTATPSQAVNNSPVITAKNIAFSPTSVTVKSGAQVTITLANQDSFVPHNLNVLGVKANDCTGPCTSSVSFTAPAPGSYTFQCSIHPSMTGTLVVVP
jgi:plastocyanin